MLKAVSIAKLSLCSAVEDFVSLIFHSLSEKNQIELLLKRSFQFLPIG